MSEPQAPPLEFEGDFVAGEEPTWNPGGDYNSAQQIISKIEAVARQKAERTMLTWNARENYRTPEGLKVKRDKAKGDLDLRLAYIGPFGPKASRVIDHAREYDENEEPKWLGKACVVPLIYHQNSKWVTSSGQEYDIRKLPVAIKVRFLVDAKARIYEEDVLMLQEQVAAAEMVFRQKALEADPLLCRVCAKVRAKNPEELIKHTFGAHPKEFAERYGEPKAKKG